MKTRFREPARELAEQWGKNFRGVMEAMADRPPHLDLADDVDAPAGRDLLWWKQPFNMGSGASIWIGTPREVWRKLGSDILSAAGIESAEDAELKSAFVEVLSQSLGALATSLGDRAGREVAAGVGCEELPGGEPNEEFRFVLRAGDEDALPVWLAISQQLLEAVLQDSVAPVEMPAPERNLPSDPPAPPSPPGTLDLLLDVEMPVSVSFGRTQLRLQDVLKLITGSIIELDRGIEEPVELIVNNCVIARGEVVVVDGNYGVRIQEIMSRRERLQQSRRYMLPGHGQRS